MCTKMLDSNKTVLKFNIYRLEKNINFLILQNLTKHRKSRKLSGIDDSLTCLITFTQLIK